MCVSEIKQLAKNAPDLLHLALCLHVDYGDIIGDDPKTLLIVAEVLMRENNSVWESYKLKQEEGELYAGICLKNNRLVPFARDYA